MQRLYKKRLTSAEKSVSSEHVRAETPGFEPLVNTHRQVMTRMLARFTGICRKGTRRERPKSAPYLRLKNIQGTTIGKIWKNFYFQKNIFF